MTAQRYQVRNAEGRIIAFADGIGPSFPVPGDAVSVQPIELPDTWTGALWEISDGTGVVGYQSDAEFDRRHASAVAVQASFRQDNIDYTVPPFEDDYFERWSARRLGLQCPGCREAIEPATECITRAGNNVCHACYQMSERIPRPKDKVRIIQHDTSVGSYGEVVSTDVTHAVLLMDASQAVCSVPLKALEVTCRARPAVHVLDVGIEFKAQDDGRLAAITEHHRIGTDGNTYDTSDPDQRASYLAILSDPAPAPEPGAPCSYCGGSGCGLSGFMACPECG